LIRVGNGKNGGSNRLVGEKGFMRNTWDGGDIAHQVEVWTEVLRVLKPGGHLLSFGGTRTYHRMVCAIEDAGFEIRDQLAWLYGSGYPKSRNLKGDWEGWGTALKPAMEPIVVARKPFKGSVDNNVLRFGVGAININACRVPSKDKLQAGAGTTFKKMHEYEGRPGDGHKDEASVNRARVSVGSDPNGRWPANVIHDGSDEVRNSFPAASGQKAKVYGDEPTANGFSGAVKFSGMLHRQPSAEPRIEDDLSAARFFYCAKASRKDREAGMDGMPEQPLNWSSGAESPGTFQSCGTQRYVKNHHPTVKPTDVMRYLIRLVTPPGGIVLDPFMGSGTTGRACVQEQFSFIGIEKIQDYFEIAQRRVFADAPLFVDAMAEQVVASK